MCDNELYPKKTVLYHISYLVSRISFLSENSCFYIQSLNGRISRNKYDNKIYGLSVILSQEDLI